MLQLTPLVRNILILNVAVYLIQMLMPGVTGIISLWPLNSGYFAAYQFFTYMFAHGSWTHIFFNMMGLISLAPALEYYWGDKKFLSFYMITGIGAGVLYAVVNYLMGASGGMMLGASGAIYGILMAFGMEFPEVRLGFFLLPIQIKAKYMVFLFGFLTFIMDRSGSVAHLAHFGGAFVAFLLITYWRMSR